jgi:3'-5' exoribonuclease
MWDNAADAIDTFERDDFVRIKGLLQIFQNRPQLTCTRSNRFRNRKSTWRITFRPPSATGVKCSASCRPGSPACLVRI